MTELRVTPQRDRRLSLRLTRIEKAELRRLAVEQELSYSELFRRWLWQAGRPSDPPTEFGDRRQTG
jgi:hypothetical protein